MLVLVLIIAGLFVLLVVGTWLSNQVRKDKPVEDVPAKEVALDCCGAHEVCDYEEMIKNPEEIVYFEDEDLDRYQDVPANGYNDDQIEEFRDVLYTLQGHEIRKWLLSIQRRKIQLPAILQQEAVQLIADS